MKLPDEHCEWEYEVVQGENDESLFPLPGSVAHLPVDQTRLNIKNINLLDLLGNSPVGDERNACSFLPSEASLSSYRSWCRGSQ